MLEEHIEKTAFSTQGGHLSLQECLLVELIQVCNPGEKTEKNPTKS